MVADLMNENVRDYVSKRVLALGPEVENGPTVKPDHIRLRACLGEMLAFRQTAAAEQAEKVEFRFAGHVRESFVVREVLHLKDNAFAKISKRLGKGGEGAVGERFDFGEGRRAELRQKM